MKLFFQCGNGVKKLSKRLSETMPGATYILSPRDLSQKGQVSFAKELRKSGNSSLFDPQLYAPHSDKKNFQTYAYWPKKFVTAEAPWKDIVVGLAEFNEELGTSAYVLPGVPCEHVGGTYLRIHESIFDAATEFKGEKLATVCLKQNVLLDTMQVEKLLVATEQWPVAGVYLIAEHPDDDYFVDSPVWMLNLLKLCSGLTIQGKKVILGYSNHQMLPVACAGIHAIASGNWMNARSFTFDKFFDSDEIKRHKMWYYAPQTYTEFSPAYLDLAQNVGKLPILAPPNGVDTPASILFSGAMPSSVNYTNEMSFWHYLYCLDKQVREVSAPDTFQGRVVRCRESAESAKKRLEFLHKYHINGQNRDFLDYFDVNATALDLFESQAGALLSRMNHLYREAGC